MGRNDRAHQESGGGRHELPDSEFPAADGYLWFFDGYGGWSAVPIDTFELV